MQEIMGSIPRLGRSPGEGKGCPFQYSGLENSMDYIELDTTCHFTLVILDIRPGPGAQSCPTLCNPMDWSLPGSSVHGTLQARIMEWVAITFSRVSSQPRDQTQLSCIASRWFTTEPPEKPLNPILRLLKKNLFLILGFWGKQWSQCGGS